MKTMTKKDFIKFALLRGISVSYSGKLKKFFMTKVADMDIHKVINSKI